MKRTIRSSVWSLLLCACSFPAYTYATSHVRRNDATFANTLVTSAPGKPTAHPSPPTIQDPASLVNLFIGVINGGHVFPGPTLPHGMAKPGMDTDSPGNHAGYDGDARFNVTGFSQLHDDGTGGAVPLSNFKLFPLISCPTGDTFVECQTTLEKRRVLRKVLSDGSPDDFASPGYFSTNLTNGIRVELTATRRTALHRYTFPAGVVNPRLIIDFTNDGSRSATSPEGIIDSKTGRVMASARFEASFGPGRYTAFTCVDFKGDGFTLGPPTEHGMWLENFPVKNSVNVHQLYQSFANQIGALLTFAPRKQGPTTILARVGVSFISAEQACSNAEEEIPKFDFDGVQKTARAAWNDILSRIQVKTENVDPETTKLFYSSLYRTHISPADYTGENPKWNSTEPYYDSLYCNWDTYRTLYPLMSLHDPENFARIVRGMINIQQHEGWLPECRGATAQHYIQGGSNADPILAEFFVKFHQQAKALHVDANALYNALVTDAEKQPPNFNLMGRQANILNKIGYIPSDVWDPAGTNTKQVSRTLEHAFGDFAISQVAKILGKKQDVAKFAKRSENFHNVWNPNVTAPGRPDISGFFQPRFLNGTFNFTDPRHCSVHAPDTATCFLDPENTDGFYESSPFVYSQYVPHDTAALIKLQGGTEKFIDRLNFIMDEDFFDSTDEPSQQIPYMFHYANRPGLSIQRSRQVIAQFYNTSINGLPGNDDSGAMGSYVAFYLAGLYPLPATSQILLGSPYFPEISFKNPVLGTTTTIRSKNFKGNPTNGTGGNVFVKSVTIDGKPWKSNCFLEWEAFQKGSTIELELTDDINVTCGRGAGALPASLSTGGFD
ncbi:glycoside hydrolase family 92 protein [Cristinia sonorae]|uniref:Glycoside hydrolase family 92 protein n=1 Tax=Cristinia sonorae TaxID=1940300 RepID=A0A8K0XSZ5_9AGAR|nr:glycoside hydrolase family 92 protein [Cristinia sonorae]